MRALCVERRGWDSNPCARKDKRFSRPPRYDHFATSPDIEAAGRIRTANLLITNQLLCQLSHGGILCGFPILASVIVVLCERCRGLSFSPYIMVFRKPLKENLCRASLRFFFMVSIAHGSGTLYRSMCPASPQSFLCGIPVSG